MNRRTFLRTVGGATAVGASAQSVSAQEGNESGGSGNGSGGSSGGNGSGGGGGGTGPIDYGGWFSDVPYWGGPGSTEEMTGQSEVTIAVGASANSGNSYQPGAVHVDPGTTVIWEWEGSGHNVLPESIPGGASWEGSSELSSSGATYEHTFETAGIYEYYCEPHLGLGMKGAVAVGTVPRSAPAAPVEPAVSDQAKTLGVATMIALVSTLSLAFFFLKYGGDYE
ncbi:halocyanin domain-containing protein [Halomarina salina]|uniref:Halocyanin domain-containing protein n=1 Tax=Halomarina salina TaxID=1872699 RepID=A0ABD5RSR3_9EURY|nr:halocyanin domain-containing protein [Halomarina salina]